MTVEERVRQLEEEVHVLKLSVDKLVRLREADLARSNGAALGPGGSQVADSTARKSHWVRNLVLAIVGLILVVAVISAMASLGETLERDFQTIEAGRQEARP